jgi:hypothetical protein
MSFQVNRTFKDFKDFINNVCFRLSDVILDLGQAYSEKTLTEEQKQLIVQALADIEKIRQTLESKSK